MKGGKTEKIEPASLVCYLDEADPAYAGYLSPAELAVELRRVMARVKDDRVHAKLMSIVIELEAKCRTD